MKVAFQTGSFLNLECRGYIIYIYKNMFTLYFCVVKPENIFENFSILTFREINTESLNIFTLQPGLTLEFPILHKFSSDLFGHSGIAFPPKLIVFVLLLF